MRKTSVAAALAAVLACASTAHAADQLTFATPGVPAVFGGIVAFVGKDAGIFSKYGLDVTVKPMDSGAAAASAVEAGSIDVSLSPTQFVATMVSNAGAPVKAIWGMEKSDWLMTTMDASKTSCDALKGQGVGVDSPRGARWIQANNFLLKKCPNLALDKDVPSVSLGSNVGTAMASGQLTFGILHVDDVPVIERTSGKKVHVIARLEELNPGQHYLVLAVRSDNLAKKRDAFVRLVAALRDTAAYMADPKNADKVAKMAAPTKRDPADAKAALATYNGMGYWPTKTAGLDKTAVEKAIAQQVAAGKASGGKSGIKPDKTAVTYDNFVDLTVWRDAEKVKK
jgi:NitT/TauT family transport system substrate-binding protein